MSRGCLPPPPILSSVTVGGKRVQTYLWGPVDGERPMVLVHGSRAHSGWWHFLIPHLAGRPVLAVDTTGSGHSERRDSYSTEVWAAEIVAATRHTWGDVPVTLVGHSLGGLQVLAASTEPGVAAGVILVDALILREDPPDARPAYRDGHLPRTFPSFDAAVAQFRLLPPQPQLDACAHDYIAARSVTRCGDVWGWRFDPRSVNVWNFAKLANVLPRVTSPVGVVRGQLSEIAKSSDLGYLREVLCNQVQVRDVAGAHHHLVLTHPAETAAAILDLESTWDVCA